MKAFDFRHRRSVSHLQENDTTQKTNTQNETKHINRKIQIGPRAHIHFSWQATQKYVLWGFLYLWSKCFLFSSVSPHNHKCPIHQEKVLDSLEFLYVFILNQISQQVFVSVMKISSRQGKKWLKVQVNYSPLISGDSTFPGKRTNVICSTYTQ